MDCLVTEAVVFVFAGLQGCFLGIQFTVFAVCLGGFLVQGVLFLPHAVFGVTDFGIGLVDHFLVFAFEGEILLLCLEDAFVLDFFGLDLRFLKDFFLFPLEDGAPHDYVCRQGYCRPGYKSDY